MGNKGGKERRDDQEAEGSRKGGEEEKLKGENDSLAGGEQNAVEVAKGETGDVEGRESKDASEFGEGGDGEKGDDEVGVYGEEVGSQAKAFETVHDEMTGSKGNGGGGSEVENETESGEADTGKQHEETGVDTEGGGESEGVQVGDKEEALGDGEGQVGEEQNVHEADGSGVKEGEQERSREKGNEEPMDGSDDNVGDVSVGEQDEVKEVSSSEKAQGESPAGEEGETAGREVKMEQKVGGGADILDVFGFWFVLVASVAVVAAAIVIAKPVFSNDPHLEFLKMPPSVRHHFQLGMHVKVPDGQGGAIDVFVRSTGLGKGASQKETVLLLHGMGGSSFSFRKVLNLLAENGYRAVAFDFPGSGLSESPKNATHYETNNLARNIGAVMDALSLPAVHLVLHDTSGMLGVAWAGENPDRVRSITFLDADTEAPFRSSIPRGILQSPTLISFLARFELIWLPFFRWCCAKQAPAEVAAAHAYLLLYNNGARAAELTVAGTNKSQAFGQLLNVHAVRSLGKVPRQQVWSAGREEQAEEMQANWPLSDVHFHGGGRWPQEDEPELIASRIIGLVSSVSRASSYSETRKDAIEDYLKMA